MYNDRAVKRKKKIIEISILSIVVLYILLFIVDYVRYKNSMPPLITINKKTVEFSDGEVKEYFGLGWVYREYRRKAIGKIELKSFLSKMARPQAVGSFPVTKKDYEVPDNPDRLDELKGIIYFYGIGSENLRTYKCLNTANDCFKATSGSDDYNISTLENNTEVEEPKFALYNKRYAFIDDSYKQEDKANKNQYERTIYLLDLQKNEIIGEYKDIKYSLINKEGLAEGYLGRYIVKGDNHKWGIIEITNEGINNLVDFVYDSINFNEATKEYIVLKDEKWYLLNDKTKEESEKFGEIIVDAYFSNGKKYVKTITIDKRGLDTFKYYKIFNSDGSSVLNTNNLVLAFVDGDYAISVDTNNIFRAIRILDNKVIFDGIKLAHTNYIGTNDTLPAFKVDVYSNGEINVLVSPSTDINSYCTRYSYDFNKNQVKVDENRRCR